MFGRRATAKEIETQQERFEAVQELAKRWLTLDWPRAVKEATHPKGILSKVRQAVESNAASEEVSPEMGRYEIALWEFLIEAMCSSDGRRWPTSLALGYEGFEDDPKEKYVVTFSERQWNKLVPNARRCHEGRREECANIKQMAVELLERMLAAESLTDFRELDESLLAGLDDDYLLGLHQDEFGTHENNILIGELQLLLRKRRDPLSVSKINPIDHAELKKEMQRKPVYLMQVLKRRVDIAVRRKASR